MNSGKNAIFRTVQSALIGAAFLGLAMVSLNAAAGSAESKIAVTATVLKHASLKVLAQPSSVTITAADIARGYVDVASPAQLAVKSNTLDGYLLVFANHGDFVSQIRVKGLSNEVQLGAAGGAVTQPAAGRGMNTTQMDLGYRFELSASAQQGVYAWPMQVSVQPL